MNARKTAAVVLLFASFVVAQQKRGRKGPDSGIFHTDVPAHSYDLILCRAEATSVTASVLASEDLEGYVDYGAGKTSTVSLLNGKPVELLLAGLRPDTAYKYRFYSRKPNAAAFDHSDEFGFHTQRPAGSGFTFAVQADSHLDENTSPQFYTKTLINMAAGVPDFLVDLGDTFMTDKRRGDYKEAFPQYLAQRYYFGLIGRVAPVFLALGNHDGEGGSRGANGMSAWSIANRKRYFPNPEPDAFFTGNSTPDPAVGLLQDYYAWTWGDALFVVLDPYWPTQGRGQGEDNWNWTLGDAQYRWLRQTIESRQARYKLVFLHHPTGSKSQPIRGGIEAAKYNEWGGLNADGSDGFKQHRPAWDKPVHRLLTDAGVTAVFHGHDHVYVKEEMDGVIYQAVPQPGNPRAGGSPRSLQEYGYTHGGAVAGSGYLRVTVSPAQVNVEFMRTTEAGSEVADSYLLKGNRKGR